MIPARCARPWVLWHNNKGTLEDAGPEVLPLDVPAGELKGPVWIDYDLDGWLDLLIPGAPSMLFKNVPGREGSRRFERTDLSDISFELEEPPGLLQEIYPESEGLSLGEQLRQNLVFGACSVDLNQDGRDDVQHAEPN